MSNDRRPYSREAMLGWMFDGDRNLADFEPTVRRWARPVYTFTMSGFGWKYPLAKLLLLPPASPEELSALFTLSEMVAGMLDVEMGGVGLNGAFQGRPHRYGPLGTNAADVHARGVDEVSPRTFFAPAIWAQVEAAFGAREARVLPNGVVAVDFINEPWLAGPESIARALKEAREQLERAGLAAGKNLDRGRKWTPIAAEATKTE